MRVLSVRTSFQDSAVAAALGLWACAHLSGHYTWTAQLRQRCRAALGNLWNERAGLFRTEVGAPRWLSFVESSVGDNLLIAACLQVAGEHLDRALHILRTTRALRASAPPSLAGSVSSAVHDSRAALRLDDDAHGRMQRDELMQWLAAAPSALRLPA